MNVEIVKMEPVGNYAVRIVFDDMHDTGLFSWDYLMDLGRNKDARWQTYLDELREKGLSREPFHRGALIERPRSAKTITYQVFMPIIDA